MYACSFSKDVKQKGHILLSLSGLFSLVLTVVLMTSSRSKNDKRYMEIYDHVSALKAESSSGNAELGSMLHGGLKKELRKKRGVKSEKRSKGGATYTRWGRTTCPDDGTELVYSGISGGSWYGHAGGASNQQCLPNTPVWGRYTDKAGLAYMYGTEYQENMIGLIDMTNVETPIANHNVPCAVCRSKKRISSLMVPAQSDCFDDWHLEYSGYLMAGSHGSSSGTQYICVDEAPEIDKAGYRDENGAWLYRVTAQCGSLPCPEYVQNRELACAVCTK